MDISAISSAGQAFAAMRQIISAAIDVRDATRLATLKADLLAKLVEAQTATLELVEKLAASERAKLALEARLREIEEAERHRERYLLHDVGRGAFVYRLRDGVEPAEPTHYLCQPCYDKGVKAVLEHNDSVVGPTETCPVCTRVIYR